MDQVWTWVLPGVSLVAMRLAGRNNKFGWLLGALNQAAWATCGVIFHQWGFLGWGVVYIVVYLWNLWDWHQDQRLLKQIEDYESRGCSCAARCEENGT